MQRFYLVPIDTYIHPDSGKEYRGPMYFAWRFGAGVVCRRGCMDYGFFPYMLVLARDITQVDHDALILNPDVYAFPEDLSGPVNDPGVDAFLEAINVPTDWLTPATTWLELLRNLAGMFQFNQRYNGIYRERYGGAHSVFDNADIDTRLRQMSAQEQEIFLAAVESFGFDPAQVNTNSRLRQLLRQAANYWEGRPFTMAGVTF